MNTFFLTIAVMAAGFVVAFFFMFIFLYKLRKHEKPSKAYEQLNEVIEAIKEVARVISSGTWTYLRLQYKLAAIVLSILATLLLIMWHFDLITIYTIFAATSGFIFSMIVGSFGVSVAVRANALIARDSNISLMRAKNTSALAGNITGLFAHGFVLIDLAFWMALIYFCEKDIIGGSVVATFSILSTVVVTFGIGASSYALIARVGGGVYTKGADVGSDNVGKGEMDLEEDSPLNPGVTADIVGDNVGDINGQFADFYESTVGIMIAPIVLFTATFVNNPKMLVNSVLLLMSLMSFGIISSLVGMFLSRARSNDEKKIISSNQRGLFISTLVLALFSVPVSYFTAGIVFSIPIILGLILANMVSFVSEFFNSSAYSPVKKLVKIAKQGVSLLTTANFANGKTSAGISVLLLVLVGMIPISIFLPAEIFAASVSFMAAAMIANLSLILSQDAEGPMSDNAQGINEMTGASEFAIKNTNLLDSIGNTTAAKLKGFAISSAALTAFLMILAYIETVEALLIKFGLDPKIVDWSFKNPKIMMGLFIGGSLIFLLNGYLISVVGKVGRVLGDNIRSQITKIFQAAQKGIEIKPDPNQCIAITTKASQKSLWFPLTLALLGSLIPGLIGGVVMVVGVLAGATAVGVLSSLFQANMGGSADNTKKAIEGGEEGGKHSPAHKNAIAIDTLGDPLKDTSGPAINIFIKLLSMISIVSASLIVFVKYVM